MNGTAQRVLPRVIRYRRLIGAATHLCAFAFSSYCALWLRFDGTVPAENWIAWSVALPLIIAVRGLTFIPFRLYHGLWRYTSVWDLRNILLAVGLSTAISFVITHSLLDLTTYPRSVYIIDSVLLVCLVGGFRLLPRIYRELARSGRRRVLVFGAGDAGEMILREMKANPGHDYLPVGVVDDDARKHGQHIHGVPVLGSRDDLPEIMRRCRPEEVLIAIPSATPGTLRDALRSLEPFKVRITTVPNLRDIVEGAVDVSHIRTLQLEDLLARAPVGLDPVPLHALIAGRRVLVTGAGGSIGSELGRQIARLGPERLLLLDRYENGLFALTNELEQQVPRLRVAAAIADVTDRRRVDDVFAEYRPEIVFHAAAHKHVPLMEAHPCEAVKNNVGGSRVIAEAAQRHGVERVVLISTDKAVNPSSVMGATKRLAELVVREVGERNGTRFVIVRFGNVLGSNGSVVPTFLDQIRRGGPVTVTHPDVRRYFMLIPEAVQLVLHAASLDDQSCIYALDMGEQIRVVDIARHLIRLAGYIPEREVSITFIGLRPGEKLSEELVGSDEVAEPSGVAKVMRLRSLSAHPLNGRLLAEVERLEHAAACGQQDAVVRQLCVLVPNFVPGPDLAPRLAGVWRR